MSNIWLEERKLLIELIEGPKVPLSILLNDFTTEVLRPALHLHIDSKYYQRNQGDTTIITDDYAIHPCHARELSPPQIVQHVKHLCNRIEKVAMTTHQRSRPKNDRGLGLGRFSDLGENHDEDKFLKPLYQSKRGLENMTLQSIRLVLGNLMEKLDSLERPKKEKKRKIYDSYVEDQGGCIASIQKCKKFVRHKADEDTIEKRNAVVQEMKLDMKGICEETMKVLVTEGQKKKVRQNLKKLER